MKSHTQFFVLKLKECMSTRRWAGICSLFILTALMASCSATDEPTPDEESGVELPASGLFIVNEGNFNYGNATLSFYDPATGECTNELFTKANGAKLGDVAQSMTIHGGKGWIAVNNSSVIFAIDLSTAREVGRITGVGSPRYIHFVSDTKAYVSQIWSSNILIINPTAYTVTGRIEVSGMTDGSGSTEQMVQIGRYVYCNCWSYQDRIIKIDTATDEVVGSLRVGLQPCSLAVDRLGRLWTLTDGGYEGSFYGYEAPRLVCVDPDTFAVIRSFTLPMAEVCSELQTNGDRSKLLWINDGIWQMDVEADELPAVPLIPSKGTIFYGLTVDPRSGEIYVADAIDYQQHGIVYRYTPQGQAVDSFYAGIMPGAFCWK